MRLTWELLSSFPFEMSLCAQFFILRWLMVIKNFGVLIQTNVRWRILIWKYHLLSVASILSLLRHLRDFENATVHYYARKNMTIKSFIHTKCMCMRRRVYKSFKRFRSLSILWFTSSAKESKNSCRKNVSPRRLFVARSTTAWVCAFVSFAVLTCVLHTLNHRANANAHFGVLQPNICRLHN